MVPQIIPGGAEPVACRQRPRAGGFSVHAFAPIQIGVRGVRHNKLIKFCVNATMAVALVLSVVGLVLALLDQSGLIWSLIGGSLTVLGLAILVSQQLYGRR